MVLRIISKKSLTSSFGCLVSKTISIAGFLQIVAKLRWVWNISSEMWFHQTYVVLCAEALEKMKRFLQRAQPGWI